MQVYGISRVGPICPRFLQEKEERKADLKEHQKLSSLTEADNVGTAAYTLEGHLILSSLIPKATKWQLSAVLSLTRSAWATSVSWLKNHRCEKSRMQKSCHAYTTDTSCWGCCEAFPDEKVQALGWYEPGNTLPKTQIQTISVLLPEEQVEPS